jgi:hypothetical protein
MDGEDAFLDKQAEKTTPSRRRRFIGMHVVEMMRGREIAHMVRKSPGQSRLPHRPLLFKLLLPSLCARNIYGVFLCTLRKLWFA